MATLKVKQVRSKSGHTERQRATLIGLGFKKREQVRELNDTPEVRGMIRKVQHLVEVLGE